MAMCYAPLMTELHTRSVFCSSSLLGLVQLCHFKFQLRRQIITSTQTLTILVLAGRYSI